MSISESTVFIVDGEKATRRALRQLLTPMGVSTQEYASAERFLNDYDPQSSGCLITDLRLNGMSGIDLMNSLIAEENLLPTIVHTAVADVPAAVEIMQLGAVTVLEKPCREIVLWEAIRRALVIDQQRREAMQTSRETAARMHSLTADERRILDLILDGIPNKAIATRLDVSVRTVEGKRKEVFRKMGANCVAQLVRIVLNVPRAPKSGLLESHVRESVVLRNVMDFRRTTTICGH